MPPEPSAPAKPGSPRPAKLRHLLAGPLVFAVLLLIPLGGLAFETRGAMGLLVWMAWWWITRPVHLAVTGLLPLPIAAVFLLPSSAGGPAVAAGLRSEPADDGRQRSLRFTSGTPDSGGVGLRFGQVVAGIRSGVMLYTNSFPSSP